MRNRAPRLGESSHLSRRSVLQSLGILTAGLAASFPLLSRHSVQSGDLYVHNDSDVLSQADLEAVLHDLERRFGEVDIVFSSINVLNENAFPPLANSDILVYMSDSLPPDIDNTPTLGRFGLERKSVNGHLEMDTRPLQHIAQRGAPYSELVADNHLVWITPRAYLEKLLSSAEQAVSRDIFLREYCTERSGFENPPTYVNKEDISPAQIINRKREFFATLIAHEIGHGYGISNTSPKECKQDTALNYIMNHKIPAGPASFSEVAEFHPEAGRVMRTFIREVNRHEKIDEQGLSELRERQTRVVQY